MVGKLRLSEWTGRDGDKRSRLQVVADAVQFLGKPTKAGDSDGAVAETDDKPADGPALGQYRKAS
jgi:single-stranded DNA-binding protein